MAGASVLIGTNWFPERAADPQLDSLEELPVDWPLDALAGPLLHLEPYLGELSTEEAIAGLNQLADSVLWPAPGHAPPSDASAGSPRWAAVWSPEADPSQTGNFWPASFSSSSFSSTYSVCSGPASVASSYDSPSCSSPTSSSSSSTVGSGRGQAGAGGVSKRRGKNAKAAERYRNRLKGRQCGLMEQTRREQERNSRLKRELETKLSLYREFVSLLANNTSPADVHLASFGSKSVSAILSQVLLEEGNCVSATNQRNRELIGHLDELVELRQQLNKFHRILAANKN